MYVRRKSNWYIYFIAFGITVVFVLVAILAFRWYLFPTKTQDTGLDKDTGELADNFKPTAEHSFNILAMLSEGVNDNPEFFYAIEYNAPENRVAFVPLPNGICVGSEERTLPNIYAAQGGAKTVKAVENEIGIRFDSFVKMDRQSFGDILTAFGNVDYALPKTIMVKEDDKTYTFNSGRQSFTSDEIFQLIMKVEYEEGESYKFKLAGDILSELVNQNYQSLDGNLFDSYYEMIAKNAETDITEEKYKQHKAALLNSVEYGVSPAEFYVPYGEYGSDGSFKISENSITTIKQKAGLE